MTADGLDVSLVIACYNEADHLESSVAQVLEVLDVTRWSYELIFVDDCSRDNTRELIARIVAGHADRNMRVLLHEVNTGRGRTVTDGIGIARGEVAGFIDIDLEVHARYIPAMVLAVRGGADVATAHRVYKLVPSLFHRHVLSRGYVALMNRLLGVTLDDTEAGYKFFNRRRILPILEQTQDPGWFWDTEIMVRAALAGLRIEAIPALFIRNPRKTSTVRVFRDTYEYFVNLWRFRRVARQLRRTEGVPSHVA